MPRLPSTRNRRSIRLDGYNYACPGAYFITLCTYRREPLFGQVKNGAVDLSPVGELAEACWLSIEDHFSNVRLDEFVIMPNHLHGLIFLANTSDVCAPPESGCRPGSVGAVIGSFKSETTRRTRQFGYLRGVTIWQRNYFEHVVRDEAGLERIREYIVGNSLRWDLDRENPLRSGSDDFDMWLAQFRYKRPSA